MRRAVLTSVCALLISSTGCCCNWNERTTGTIIGTGAGAIAGGLLGSAVGSTAAGAVIGGVAGGTAGYIIGDRMADRRERGECAPKDGCGCGAPSSCEPPPCSAPRSRCEPPASCSVPPMGASCAPPACEPPPPDPRTAAPVPCAGPLRYDRASLAQREYDLGRGSGTPAQAIVHYDRAIRMDPARPEPYNAKGMALLQEGKTDEARRAFEKAAAADPGYAPAQANLRRLASK